MNHILAIFNHILNYINHNNKGPRSSIDFQIHTIRCLPTVDPEKDAPSYPAIHNSPLQSTTHAPLAGSSTSGRPGGNLIGILIANLAHHETDFKESTS